MTPLAFVLVLMSALLHAAWNLITKRTNGGQPFVWLISTFSTLLLLPIVLVIVVVQRPLFGFEDVVFILLSSLLHSGYYLALNRAYTVGDLSLVYPLARGGAPVLTTFGAVLLLGERPTAIAVGGAVLISAGTFVLIGNPLKTRDSSNYGAIIYGFMTAGIVAAYTLSDKHIVDALMVSPLILIFASSIFRAVVLLPMARQHSVEIGRIWQEHRRAVLTVALVDPLSYMLFLIALAFSQVSYIAPVRQSSVLIGAFLGVRLLSEGHARQRLAAAGIMMVGLVALGFR